MTKTKSPAMQEKTARNSEESEGAVETAMCTLCAQEKSPFFYTGCLIKDGHSTDSGWDCDGSGNLTRPIQKSLQATAVETDLIGILRELRPSYGAPGSRDEDVTRQRNQIDVAIAQLKQAAAFNAELKPVAWVRFRSDGGVEGPLMDDSRDMSDVRRTCGAWNPLFLSEAIRHAERARTLEEVHSLLQAHDCQQAVGVVANLQKGDAK
jgi:hypothetical protein